MSDVRPDHTPAETEEKAPEPPKFHVHHTLEARADPKNTGVTPAMILAEFARRGMPDRATVTATQSEVLGLLSSEVIWSAKWREERHG